MGCVSRGSGAMEFFALVEIFVTYIVAHFQYTGPVDTIVIFLYGFKLHPFTFFHFYANNTSEGGFHFYIG